MASRIFIPLLLLALPPVTVRAVDADAMWISHIRPLLDTTCVKCHGPLEEKSGLILDSLEGIMKGGDGGQVVVPGKPEESTLWTYLAASSDPHMPPKKQLPQADMDMVREWIISLAKPQPAKPAETPVPAAEIPTEPAAAIDFFLNRAWQRGQVTPAPVSDDRTFGRRVWLDLAGRAPSVEEMEAFLFSSDPDKRTALVDRLLASPEYARNMREVYDVLLMTRGPDGRRQKRRKDNGWFAYLEDVFAKNRPWDEVVREIIAARPDSEEKKGAVWFVYERRNEHQQLAEAVAPIIYGTQVACAQCHDHPLAREIKQGHYWGLVAAFNRSKNIEGGGPPAVDESAVGGFVNFTNLKKESQPAVVMMLTGRTLSEEWPKEGAKEDDAPEKYEKIADKLRVPKYSRRGALAESVTHDNPLLARAFVNRTWAQFFGRGIVHPVDEMNSRNAPAHPALLDWLSEDFRSHNYDIRRLIRGIVLSQAWQRASWSGPADKPAPAPEMFACAVEKPITGEALARSILVALGRPADNDDFLREMTSRFTDVMPREYLATTQQAMFMTNSPAVADLLKPDPGTTAAALLGPGTPEEHTRTAFLRVLGRLPDAEELARVSEFLKSKTAQPEAAVKELLWALFSGPEFSMNR
ncbi:MAG: hypothetical protein JWM59_1155 [Verrucomicrobiales bacterium]|nr:hypothetical protein [Verrucomicrobiales bacterium]